MLCPQCETRLKCTRTLGLSSSCQVREYDCRVCKLRFQSSENLDQSGYTPRIYRKGRSHHDKTIPSKCVQ